MAERSGLYMAHGLPPIVVEGSPLDTRVALASHEFPHFKLATEPGHVYVNPAHVVCVVAAREQSEDEQRAARAPRIVLA